MGQRAVTDENELFDVPHVRLLGELSLERLYKKSLRPDMSPQESDGLDYFSTQASGLAKARVRHVRSDNLIIGK